MENTIKSYVQQVITANGKNENLLIRTDKIQQSAQNMEISNFDVFEVLYLWENKELIKINSVASQGQQYSERLHWLELCDQFTRNNIDVLKPEYFNIAHVDDPNWAIKAYFDEAKSKFFIELNGVGVVKEITVAKTFQGKETNIFRILKRLQDNSGEVCPVNDICFKYLDTVREFFYRFSDNIYKSENLFPLLIEAPKGSGSLCFHSVIYPDELRFRKIQAIGFQDMHKRPDNGDYLERTAYHCVFDDSGFKGWV